jgi:hypothetical protein
VSEWVDQYSAVAPLHHCATHSLTHSLTHSTHCSVLDMADRMEVEEKEKGEEVASQLPWIEKYRPKSLGELIAHDEIINICE